MYSSSSTSMASFFFFFFFVSILFFADLSTTHELIKAQKVPAIYVFGDSLVDVGNNNYIDLSLLKANFPHYGIDYPGGQATGRFSNGKNPADLIAERLGVASSPPFLSNPADVYLTGVSFASGGSGLLNSTGQGFLKKCLTLMQQVEYFSTVHNRLESNLGVDGAKIHLSKSLFSVIIGSNDFFQNFKSGDDNSPNVDQLVSIFKGFLKSLHGLGGRKFFVTGVPAIGCTPRHRLDTDGEECNEEMNALAIKYNNALKTMLKGLKAELNDSNYTFFDLYSALMDLINNPAEHGFVEIKAACCGYGRLNADGFCIPISYYCPDRKDHIFWDRVHPTEATNLFLVDALFKGSHTTPLSLEELVAL